MSLDLSKIISQVEGLAAKLQRDASLREERLALAIRTLSSTDLESLRAKAKASEGKVTWLVAGLGDGLDLHFSPQELPTNYSVVATDGSHIDVDRHMPPPCYVINIGGVVLRYGESPACHLLSEPTLYAQENDLFLKDPRSNHTQAIEGALLGIKRTVKECEMLGELLKEAPHDLPTLALLDGSLILWGLSGKEYQDFVKQEFLEKGLLKAMEAIKETDHAHGLALASYISFPRNTDVVNCLRLSLCPYEPVADCDRFCGEKAHGQRECDGVSGLTDRDILQEILKAGERSAVFANQSSIVREHYGDNWIHFFYLNVGDELARVEFPGWVEERPELVELLHSLTLEQCHKGQGYPVSLMEAHEKAVISTQDRALFTQMLEHALAGRRIPAVTSAKSNSKRIRWT
ncbi:MAG: DNA double-strand break repair nuclease NurA [Chloroflexi bacterium]|nr:DNA double-strand break repair nuclease NurA [Chloroflexota bacterium]